MKYVISGRALENVLRENRIRISKGELIVTPFEEAEVVEDTKAPVVEDTKDVDPADEKKPAKKGKK